jgi:hypothetical protein
VLSSFANSHGGVLILGVEAQHGVPKPPFNSLEPSSREELALTPQFGWAYGSSEALAGVELGGKYGFIDHGGHFVVPATFEDVREFSEGLAAVKQTSKWGYIDKHGSTVIEPRFDSNALPFRTGIAQVRLSNGELGYVNKTGEYVWKPAS